MGVGMRMRGIVRKIQWALDNGNIIFTCGNGGSASTAEHFSNDLFSVGVRTICLNSNMTLNSMLSNDYGYDVALELQFMRLAEPNDILIVFSVSGESANIYNLLHVAQDYNIKTIAFTGKTGGSIVKDNLCDYVYHAKSDSFELAEDEHLKACHRIKAVLK